ncbi:MAG TPA: antitoxin Xre/MbcA/ParS toxin-binding domain-containing protein [Thermoanaerobaculia bacterium]|nr:antitoxin Xre/MbcA/ParS toxin-binding domain-containing protein [Thermoanaerobaculia bacterium]
MSQTRQHPAILFTSPGSSASAPQWLESFSPRVVTGNRVQTLRSLPDITVVGIGEPRVALQDPLFFQRLAGCQQATPGLSEILFVLSKPKRRSIDEALLTAVLRFFRDPQRIRFSYAEAPARLAVEEAIAKVRLSEAFRAPVAARLRDPLAEVQEVVRATASLRADSGRWSARKVAEAFGLTVAELAGLLGRTRQALWKTDDAESIQGALAPFVRTARLLGSLSREDFRAWLNTPNPQLEERAPLSLVRAGQVAIVADLVADLLTGSFA